MTVTANVFYTCSDSYAPYAGISMVSLLQNNQHIARIRVFVVGDHVSQDNIARFEKQAAEYGREFSYIDGAPYIKQMKELGMPTYRNVYAPNLRLFFSEWVDDEMERLLYLDCDTLACGDISELFTIDMGEENCIAAVRDSLGQHYKRLIGYEKTTPYVNAGVILFDIKNWVNGDWSRKLLVEMKNPDNRHPNADQDYLNLALNGHIYLLPPKYNFQPVHKVYSNKTYYVCYSKENYYTDTELSEAKEEPAIIHAYRYLGQFSWHEGSVHPFRRLYDSYKRQSEWKDMEPVKNYFPATMKIERRLIRILPPVVFLKLFAVVQYHMFRREEKQMRGGKQ